MHRSVKNFVSRVKERYPDSFINKNVLEVGSLDINGSVRQFFTRCNYTGIDITKGPGVDIVSPVHQYHPSELFDTIISTEMLEHDIHMKKSLKQMVDLLKPGGLLLITAAGYGRPEHGTTASSPGSSPATNDYYCNVTAKMLTSALPLESFSQWDISYINHDIRFYGIKITD
jgi:SAM-dependent methyltransferase